MDDELAAATSFKFVTGNLCLNMSSDLGAKLLYVELLLRSESAIDSESVPAPFSDTTSSRKLCLC